MMTTDPVSAWTAFASAVRARLEGGRKLYGDRSFLLEPEVLAGEVEEELMDVAAWSFILWVRLRSIRASLEAARKER